MGLVGLLGDAGLGTLLAGEIIRNPKTQHGLIMAAILVALFLSVAVSGIGLWLLGLSFAASQGLTSDLASNVLLVIGSGLTGMFFVLDQAFVGMLKSAARVLRQLLFSAAKLVLLPAAALWSANESSILFTWVAGGMISFVAVELFLRRKNDSLLHRPDFKTLLGLRRKATDHYLLDLAIQAPTMIMPYLVTMLLSPSQNAVFTAIWMIIMVASVVPASLANVLFPVIRAEPLHHREKMLISMAISFGYSLAIGLLILAFSTDILRVFNPTYAEIGGSSLSYLGFGLVGSSLKYHICTEARVRNRMRSASMWFFCGGLFELACCSAGSRVGGLQGFVLGWVIAVAFEAIAILVIAISRANWRWTTLPVEHSDRSLGPV
jgi:O-antigen/teichoic acid export membrane protein